MHASLILSLFKVMNVFLELRLLKSTTLPPRMGGVINEVQFFGPVKGSSVRISAFSLSTVVPKSAYMRCHARDRPNPGFNPQVRNIVLQIIVCAMSHTAVRALV